MRRAALVIRVPIGAKLNLPGVSGLRTDGISLVSGLMCTTSCRSRTSTRCEPTLANGTSRLVFLGEGTRRDVSLSLGIINAVSDHRKNGLLALGSAMVGVGAAYLVSWLIAVQTSKPSEHRHYWNVYSYLSLAALLVGLAMLLAVTYDWTLPHPRDTKQNRKPTGLSQRIPQESFKSDGAPNKLEISIEREEWHPFRFKALFGEVKLRIYNKSDRPVRLGARHAELQIQDPMYEPPSFDFVQDIDVARERYRLEQTRNPWPREIEPFDTVRCWYVLTFPNRPQGGEPGYEIVISDETRHEYGVRRLPRPK
jgi:hypothetical protein